MEKKKHSIIRFWPLLLLLAAVLFPVEWLGELYPSLGPLFAGPLAGDIQHTIGHLGLFGALGVIALIFFPTLRKKPLLYLGILMSMALFQEGFQLLFKQRGVGFDEWRDIGMDLGALLLAFGGMWIWERQRQRQKARRDGPKP